MFYLRPARFLVKALVTDNSPSQMALGFSLGVMIGLVPKGNLIAIGLMLILGAVRLNLGVGMLTAFAVSWLGGWLDPMTDRIGRELLTAPQLNAFWTEFYNMPVTPWTKFNNTVVLGSFALGAAMLIPMFLISRPLFAKYTPAWSEKLAKYKLMQLLWGTEMTSKLN